MWKLAALEMSHLDREGGGILHKIVKEKKMFKNDQIKQKAAPTVRVLRVMA